MKKYKIKNIIGTFGYILDKEIEANDEYEAYEMILKDLADNLDCYVDIDLEESGGEHYENI